MARMRVQLLKQDAVTRLEEELNTIDREESRELFLGTCRGDNNQHRLDTMVALEKALDAYGLLLPGDLLSLLMP